MIGKGGANEQRLSIARALTTKSEVLPMDEPCSALDPITIVRVEELIFCVLERRAIVLVTNDMAQGARMANSNAFMYLGKFIRFSPTTTMFVNSESPRTRNYIIGRIG